MATELLSEFFRAKQLKASPAGVDWAAKRDVWIEAVNDLYDMIEKDYLASSMDIVQVDRSHLKTVNEMNIGTYTYPK